MLTSYLLMIVTLAGSYNSSDNEIYKWPVYTFQEFTNKQSCETAKAAVLRNTARFKSHNVTLGLDGQIVVDCVPKGNL